VEILYQPYFYCPCLATGDSRLEKTINVNATLQKETTDKCKESVTGIAGIEKS